VEEGVLPHANNDDVEEERRVAYVGVTRAKRLLGLTYANERFRQHSKPSRFLNELAGKKPADWRDLVPQETCSLDAEQVEALRRGDLVAAFGLAFSPLSPLGRGVGGEGVGLPTAEPPHPQPLSP